jgi:hypothetical protein
MHARSVNYLQLKAVRVKPPISHMAEALESTFGRRYRPIVISGATDHDTLLQTPEMVTVRTDQVFEKADPITHRSYP